GLISDCVDLAVFIISFFFFFQCSVDPRDLHSFPTRRSSDLETGIAIEPERMARIGRLHAEAYLRRSGEVRALPGARDLLAALTRSEEHTSELQSRRDLVCRLLLEKKKKNSTLPSERC